MCYVRLDSSYSSYDIGDICPEMQASWQRDASRRGAQGLLLLLLRQDFQLRPQRRRFLVGTLKIFCCKTDTSMWTMQDADEVVGWLVVKRRSRSACFS